MAEVLEYAARLSQVIGARPAGTEEEQQASFFIEEVLQDQAGLETSVEEFHCNPNYELPSIICCIVSIVVAILAIPLSLMVIPAFIVSLVMAAFFILEAIGISPLNNTAKRGVSQNVVAKYIPGALSKGSTADEPGMLSTIDGESSGGRSSGRIGRAQGSRKRKIIIMARYDSGKVCRELRPPFFKMLSVIHWVEIGCIALIPVSLLLRLVTNAEGGLLVVWNILTIVGIVGTIIPLVIYAMHQTAPYSEGANNNASGIAVMLEVAKRLAAEARGVAELEAEQAQNRVDDPDDLIVMHGEDAVRASGMLPVGTDLVYDDAARGTEAAGAQAEAQRAGELTADGAVPGAEAGQAAATGQASVSQAQNQPMWQAFSQQTNVRSNNNTNTGTNVPDWFKKGLEAASANKEAQRLDADTPVQRSKFADALDAAAETSAGAIEELEKKQQASQPTGSIPMPSAAVAPSPAPAPEPKPSPIAAWPPQKDARPQTPEQAVAAASSTLRSNVAAAIEEAQAAEAEANAQAAEEIAEQAAVADRTISFIPVAAEIPPEVAASEAVESADASQSDSIAKTPAEILADAHVIAAEDGADDEAKRKKREIALPSLTGAIAAMSERQQDAPLAEAAEGMRPKKKSSQAASKALAASLPSLNAADDAATRRGQSSKSDSSQAQSAHIAVAESAAPESDARTISLVGDKYDEDAAAALSSLDVEPEAKPSKERVKSSNLPTINAAGSFASASSTSSFESIGDELIANMVEDEIVIQDVDDSAYEKDTTVSGAPVGRGYVEMPKSRASRIKGIFGRRKKTEETSFSEAMGLDEGFDARKVGAARGGWESFQNESAAFDGIADTQTDDMQSDTILLDATPVSPKKRTATKAKARSTRQPASEAQGAQKRSAAASADGAAPSKRKSAKSAPRSASASTTGAAASPEASADRGDGTRHTSEQPSRSTRRTHSERQRAKQQRAAKRSSWDDEAWADDEWNGGAFSLTRKQPEGVDAQQVRSLNGASRRDKAKGRDGHDGASQRNKGRRKPGSMLSAMAAEAAEEVNASESAYVAASGPLGAEPLGREDMIDERERIRTFRATGTSAQTSALPDGPEGAGEIGDPNGSAALEPSSRPPRRSTAFDGILEGRILIEDDSLEAEEQQGPTAFQTEVWFVALGAELADNAGIKAFLSEHAQELRGAVVIDIEAMGAGTLSLIDGEGTVKRVKTSSRMKRYVTKAASALGMRVGNDKMDWRESAAYFTTVKGLPTIHVAGLDDGKPAYLGEAADTVDNLSEEKLLESTAFVLELLHNI